MSGERRTDLVFTANALRRGQIGARACMAVAVALLGGPISAGAQDDTGPPEIMRAILQGLDKTTARVSTVEAQIGGIARFGTLEIVARDCQKKPPTEPPESAAFLEITDVRPDSPAVRVFSGWMFASSPALSALEHPVYDVWVIDCRMGPPLAAAKPPSDVASESPPDSPGASQ